MKKLFSLLLAVVILPMMSSCFFEDNPLDDANGKKPIPGVGSEVTEKTGNYEVTFKFNDGVIVLDEETMQYLVKVVEDNILYFSSSTPADIIPKVGSIISARITDKTPYGLGNKVLEITNEDGMVKCVTDVATLDEIFEELELTSTTSLMDLIEREITDEEGNPIEMKLETYRDENEEGSSEENAARQTTRATIGSPEVLAITLPYMRDNGLFAQLKLSLGVQLTANFSLSKHTFELSREDFIGLGGTVGVTKDYEKEVLKLLKCRMLNGVLALGPVVLRPYIDLDSYLSVKASGTFEAGFQKGASMKYGWTEKGWFFKNTTNNGSQFFNKLSLNGRLGFGPTLELDMGVGLYTKNVALELRPKVRAEVGGELDLSNENLFKLNPSAYLDVTAGVEGGFEAEILGWELASFDVDFLNFNLLNLKWPMLPDYSENSLKVNKRTSSPLIFDAQYDVTGSALGKLLGVQPILRVYKGSSLLYDVYNVAGANNLHLLAPYTMNYELSKLEKNVTYTAKPAFEIAGFRFDVDESVNFSDMKPIAETIGHKNVTKNSATVTCKYENINSGVCGVEYWTGSEKFMAFATPTEGVNCDISLVDLKPGKTYNYRAFVNVSGNYTYATETKQFTTKGDGLLSCPDGNHPHWIDLGLPSGTQWRCCNEGASSPEAYGGYYTFGQVSTAPTRNQIKELLDNTTDVWTQLNGVNGRKFTGSNGGTIFLPAAGFFRWDGEFYGAGSSGDYWSSTPYDEDSAYALDFNSDYAYWYYYYGRDYGSRDLEISVRPVR